MKGSENPLGCKDHTFIFTTLKTLIVRFEAGEGHVGGVKSSSTEGNQGVLKCARM